MAVTVHGGGRRFDADLRGAAAEPALEPTAEQGNGGKGRNATQLPDKIGQHHAAEAVTRAWVHP